MRTAILIARRFGHFFAVLFLSSLLLAAFLWVSPGSPGRPREPVEWTTAKLGDRVCADRATCGRLLTLPEGDAPTVRVALPSGETEVEARYVKRPGPGFAAWFFGAFWAGLLRGDVGVSESFQEPALAVVLHGARWTLPLVAAALLAALVVSLFFVALLVWLPFPALRGIIRAVLLVVSIAPVFVLGYVLQAEGVLPHAMTAGVLAATVAILFVGDGNLADILLHLEHEVVALRGTDYIHAAALRGASLARHMLPGLLLPLTSISAAKVAFLLGSVVIAERLFRVPGLGEASLVAAKEGDCLLLLTLTVFVTGVVALVALVRDVLEILVDPRLRRGAAAL